MVSRAVRRRSGSYQQWLSDSQKQVPGGEAPKGGNSARRARPEASGSGLRRTTAAQRSPVWKRWTSSTRSWPVRKKNLATVSFMTPHVKPTDRMPAAAGQREVRAGGVRDGGWRPRSSWSACFRKAKLFLFILPARTLPPAGWVSALFMAAIATSMICFAVSWRHWPQDHILANPCMPCAV